MYSSAEFYNKVSSLCKDHGTNITQFAKEILHLSSATPTHWKRGTVPGCDILYQIAEYFDVSTDYLLGLDDIPSRRQACSPTQEEMALLEQFRTADPRARALALASSRAVLNAASAQFSPGMQAAAAQHDPGIQAASAQLNPGPQAASAVIPVSGFAAAGSPLFDDTNSEKTVSISEKFAVRDPRDPQYFVVEARGDSMEPKLPEGTSVVVQCDTLPEQGGLALVGIDNPSENPEYVIKLVRFFPDEIELSSYNEAYPPFRYPRSQVLSVEKIVHILENE